MTWIDCLLTLLCCVSSLLPAYSAQSYNYDVIDVNSSSLAALGGPSGSVGGRIDFQLAVVSRQSGHLFVAARDRLFQFDSELNLLHSVSMEPQCRQNKQYRQLVTSCSFHNNATLLTLLPTTTVSTDTGYIIQIEFYILNVVILLSATN